FCRCSFVRRSCLHCALLSFPTRRSSDLWFQEYWLLRRLDGADPLLPGADDVYDSFNVSYTRRWDHRFPSRASTRAYITEVLRRRDRKSTRLNSSHGSISYAVFCLKKKKK